MVITQSKEGVGWGGVMTEIRFTHSSIVLRASSLTLEPIQIPISTRTSRLSPAATSIVQDITMRGGKHTAV